MFVAGMSAGGLALTGETRLQPLGVVFGAANCIAGLGGGTSVIGERQGWEGIHLDLMRTARQRLTEQAQKRGAAGIAGVAVRLGAEDVDGSELRQLIVCQMSGTAVRDRSVAAGAPLWAATLSAQEIWALHQAGYGPSAIAIGFGSIFANGDRWAGRRQLRGESTRIRNQNIELSWMAEALQQARRLALAGVEAEAKQAGAAGIVDLQLDLQLHDANTYRLIVDVLALGTAIAPLGHTPGLTRAANAPAGMVVDVGGPRPVSV